jgi:lipoic acid synthetase
MGEVKETMRSLRDWGVDILTIGQYLQPTKEHLPVDRFVPPATFARWRAAALALGFRYCESGPLVRSSYHAERQIA